ncbi:MAG: thiamine pyrophosphate-dependent enzyme, partial [Solirubrobacteraceae bacterium]
MPDLPEPEVTPSSPEAIRAPAPPRPGPVRGLPEPETAREWLGTMTLIRRFEERAGEMYARAKVGGFLHLSIGEEATIVGSARALRDSDYL